MSAEKTNISKFKLKINLTEYLLDNFNIRKRKRSYTEFILICDVIV